MNKSEKVMATLAIIAEYHREELSDTQIKIYANDLQKLTIEQIQKAWESYRSVPRNTRFPLPAQLKEYINDGRPSVNEAWAMVPKTEEASVVWNDEISQAFGIARPHLLENRRQDAFFAFKEKYEELVALARSHGRIPVWWPTMGFSREGREKAIVEAVDKGRLTYDEALVHCPQLYAPKIKSNQALPNNQERIKRLVNQSVSNSDPKAMGEANGKITHSK